MTHKLFRGSKINLTLVGVVVAAAFFLAMVPVSRAALTFSGTSVTGDSATGIDTAGTLTIGGSSATGIVLGRTGIQTSLPGSFAVTGNATTTALSITGLAGAGGCLSVSASGAIATSTCGAGSGGSVSTSSAIAATDFPLWTSVSGTLSGTSTLTLVGTTLTQSGALNVGGGLGVTGQATTTNLSITGLAGASGCLSVSASGAVTTSTCSGGSLSGGQNNYVPLWTGAGTLGTSTLQAAGSSIVTTGGLAVGTTTNQAAGNLFVTGQATTTNLSITGLAGASGCLSVSASGAVTTSTCSGGGSAWSGLTNPTGNLTLSLGNFTTVLTAGAATTNPFVIQDTTGNIGTSSLFRVSTVGTSVAPPIMFTAQGVANGVQMNSSGTLQAIGTGNINATQLQGSSLSLASLAAGQVLAVNASGVITNANPGTGTRYCQSSGVGCGTSSTTDAITGESTGSSGDNGTLITYGSASPITVTVPSACDSGSFPPGFNFTVMPIGGGAVTLNFSISQVFSANALGAGSLTVPSGTSAKVTCQSVSPFNWYAELRASSGSTGSGSVSTSSAITANEFPYWSNASGALSGTSTLSYATSTGVVTAATSTVFLGNMAIGTTTLTSGANIFAAFGSGTSTMMIGATSTATSTYRPGCLEMVPSDMASGSIVYYLDISPTGTIQTSSSTCL